jgi:hypothetical protein
MCFPVWKKFIIRNMNSFLSCFSLTHIIKCSHLLTSMVSLFPQEARSKVNARNDDSFECLPASFCFLIYQSRTHAADDIILSLWGSPQLELCNVISIHVQFHLQVLKHSMNVYSSRCCNYYGHIYSHVHNPLSQLLTHNFTCKTACNLKCCSR